MARSANAADLRAKVYASFYLSKDLNKPEVKTNGPAISLGSIMLKLWEEFVEAAKAMIVSTGI